MDRILVSSWPSCADGSTEPLSLKISIDIIREVVAPSDTGEEKSVCVWSGPAHQLSGPSMKRVNDHLIETRSITLAAASECVPM